MSRSPRTQYKLLTEDSNSNPSDFKAIPPLNDPFSTDLSFLIPPEKTACGRFQDGYHAIIDLIKPFGFFKGLTDAALYFNTGFNFFPRSGRLSKDQFYGNKSIYHSTLVVNILGASLLGMCTAISYSKREDEEFKDTQEDPLLKKFGTLLNYLATLYKAACMMASADITVYDFDLTNQAARTIILISTLLISLTAEIARFEKVTIENSTLRKIIAIMHSILRGLVMYESLDHWPQHLLSSFKIADIGAITQETLAMLNTNFRIQDIFFSFGFLVNMIAFGSYVISNKRSIEQMFTHHPKMPTHFSGQSYHLTQTILISKFAPREDSLTTQGTFVATHTTLSSFTTLLNDALIALILAIANLISDSNTLTANHPGIITVCVFVMIATWYLLKNSLNQANYNMYTNKTASFLSTNYPRYFDPASTRIGAEAEAYEEDFDEHEGILEVKYHTNTPRNIPLKSPF